MNKKILIFIVSLIIVGVVFSAVFIRRSKKEISLSPKPQKIIVLLDWFPNTNHTGIYVAKDKGYFAAENLDVEIIAPVAGENMQVVASGKADFAVSSQEAVTQARASEIPIVSIAAILQHNTSAFASLPETNIRSVKDFEGKRYGGWGSPIEEAVLKAVMSDAGADFGKVKNITIGTTDFFTTIGRDSDFQWIFYGWDGIEAKRRGIALNTIILKDLSPILDYYTPVLVTNEDHVKNKKDLVGRFMRAVTQGYGFTIDNAEESANILLKNAPELNQDLVRQSQEWLSPQYQAEASKWGIQEREVWQRYAVWLKDHQLLTKEIKVGEAFTNEFLP